MKRLVIAWLAIVSLATAGIAYAAPDDGTVSPACADLGGGAFSITDSAVSGSLTIYNGITSCPSITYTLYVIFETPGGKLVTRSDSVEGNGTSDIVSGFSVRVPPFVTSVETYAASSDSTGTILDRGPDEPMTITVTGGAPAGGAYN
jgi:hypothetical protein